MALRGRLELPTHSLEGCCSIHLSYRSGERMSERSSHFRAQKYHSGGCGQLRAVVSTRTEQKTMSVFRRKTSTGVATRFRLRFVADGRAIHNSSATSQDLDALA